jgi:hypothetical protein
MEPFGTKELLAAWLGGELDAAGTARLLELCRAHPELLDEAARLKSLDRLLHVSVLDAGAEAFVLEVAARCGQFASETDLAAKVRRRVRFRRMLAWAAAACIAFGLMLGVWWHFQPVAVVARLEAAQWQEGQRDLKPGDQLARGQFGLTRGFAALRFRHGVDLLVEAPADFELISPMRIRLYSGSAFAHVPQNSIGFTVEGPTGRVVDKGTEFGVHVGQSRMEVHVLKGLVEAGQGSALQPLRENQALQMSAASVSAIPADVGRFLTDLPPRPNRPISWIHWAFDDAEGETAQTSGAGFHETFQPARLLSIDGTSRGPKWTAGQFGSALSFDGEDDYVQTDFPGIGGNAARTVAFWVKVPREFRPQNGYAMVCWGSTQELTEGWQISINPKEDQGPLGRLRVARMGGPIIGSTDLRDDRWHHVAVVFYGSEQPSRATQVLIYLDGQLEPTVRKGMLNVWTTIAGANTRKVAFGLNIGPANPDPKRAPTWRVFRGCLDEVFICDAALSQAEVHDLMVRNHTEAFAAFR